MFALSIGSLEFDGPYFDFDALCDEPGVYAILSHRDGAYVLLEINEAEHVREHIQLHRGCERWINQGLEIAVLVRYTADVSRVARVDIVRSLIEDVTLGVAA